MLRVPSKIAIPGTVPSVVGRRFPSAINGAGVPALAWRFSNNQPVLKAEGGYWLRSA